MPKSNRFPFDSCEFLDTVPCAPYNTNEYLTESGEHMPAGNQTLLKQNNQRAIAKYIIEHGPISRADLSKKLSISKPTVSANITALIERDLLMEIGFSESEIGKKPMLVDFNKNVRYVLVLDFISYITRGRIPVAVCNLYCEPIFIDFISLPPDFSGVWIDSEVPRQIDALFNAHHIPHEQIGKLVITAPTSCYDEQHIPFECRNGDKINLADVFHEQFAGKIAVKNDIDLAALGEKHFGVGKHVDNLLFAWIGLAIGGGLILNGNLYEGHAHSGGELAYSIVYNDWLHRYDELQNITSLEGIRRYIAAHPEEAAASVLAPHFKNDTFYLDMMIEAAANGDIFCIQFAKDTARVVARVIANLAYTLNLQMVIIGGEYTGFGSILTDTVMHCLAQIPLPPPAVTIPFYTNSAMYGAFRFGADSILKTLI